MEAGTGLTAKKDSLKEERVQSHWLAIAMELDIPVNDLKQMSFEEIDELIEKKVGKLKYGVFLGGLMPRGNPLLGFGRFLDHVSLLKRFNRVFGF